MNVQRILCPVDFSENSRLALHYATSLAKQSNAELHIVYAYYEPVPINEGGFSGIVAEPDTEPDRQRLETISPTDAAVRFQRSFLIGKPSVALLEYAKAKKIDLIVMGTHGRTGLGRLLMGSVATALMRGAPCPVMTIKSPDHAVDATRPAAETV